MDDISGTYGVFLGLDVGKDAHHAVGLDPVGQRLHDAPLPNSEPKLRPSGKAALAGNATWRKLSKSLLVVGAEVDELDGRWSVVTVIGSG